MSRRRVGGGVQVAASLVAGALLTACVSTSPWRPCGPPCGGPQLAHADAVLVDTRGATRVLLTQAKTGVDDHGPFLEGIAAVENTKLGPVKVYEDAMCAVHTRRFEYSRAAANAVLVPLAVVGEVFLAYYGGEIWDWDIPEVKEPPGCGVGAAGAEDDAVDDGATSGR